MQFGGHGSLSVELFKVKKYLKNKENFKNSFESDNKTSDLGKLQKVSHVRSLNLESSKEYEP